MARRPASARRGFARALAWNLGLLACGLVVTELVFGSWFGHGPLDPLNLVRNTVEVFRVDNLYGRPGEKITYRRDRYGLRGEYASPAAIDVLTMGGSTTDQRYIDDRLTWQSVLQADFAAHGKRVSVVNAGVDGHTTWGHLKSFELWLPHIPRLKPKYILFYVGINDLFSPQGIHYDAIDTDTRTLFDRLRDRSALYYLFRTVFGTWQATYAYGLAFRHVDFSKVRWLDTPLRSDHARLFAQKLEELGRRERALDDRARALGAKTIWVTQTMHYYKKIDGRLVGGGTTHDFGGALLNGVDLHHAMALLNARTLAVCAEVHAVCVDLASELHLDEADFYDYVHNVPSGTAKVGHYLYERLASLF